MWERFRNRHAGQTCVIIGNGPSLNSVSQEFLYEYPTFGTNRIYLREGFTPTYYVAVNPLVIHQSLDSIRGLRSAGKFIAANFADQVEGSLPLRSIPVPHFSFVPDQYVYEGHTVTFVALQIAHFMGFEKVLLVGVDHRYEYSGEPNALSIAEGPDVNHFHSEYFSNGTRWHNPDLKKSEEAYEMANQAFLLSDRRVINLTPNSALNVFLKADIPGALPPKVPGRESSVSAIVSAYFTKDFLPGRLENLLKQTLKPEVVAVCHRGSPEWDRLKGYSDVKIVSVPEESPIPTVYEAWNMGIRASTGRFITNANSDDRLFPDALLHAVRTLQSHPKYSVVYFDLEIADRIDGDPKNFFRWQEGGLQELLQACFLGPCPVWRRTLHEKYGMFDGTYQSAGDYEFWLRVASKGEKFYHLKEVLGRYLDRPDSVEHRLSVRATWETARAKSLYRPRSSQWQQTTVH